MLGVICLIEAILYVDTMRAIDDALGTYPGYYPSMKREIDWVALLEIFKYICLIIVFVLLGIVWPSDGFASNGYVRLCWKNTEGQVKKIIRLEDSWACKNCGSINTGASKRCGKCMADKPAPKGKVEYQ